MKPRRLFRKEALFWFGAALGSVLLTFHVAAAETNATQQAPAPAAAAQTNAAPEAASSTANAETNAPAETASGALTPEQFFEGGEKAYNNWVEFGVGGFFVSGRKAEFQRNQRVSGNAFGGIEDFHYQTDVAKGTTLSVDGRGIFDENDYKLRLNLTKEKLGYVKVSYDQFRTWYNGDGGFYAPSAAYFPLTENALELDRGEFSVEAGLTLDKFPKITFKYTHSYRDGEKDSTTWGPTHPAEAPAVVRGIAPSIYDLDEKRDSFQLDLTHTIKATDFGLGLRYETGTLSDERKIFEFPGEPIEQKVTDRQGTSYDLFNVHAFTETWLKKNILLSTGFSYSDLDNDLSGSRIYGSDFDVGYAPAAQNGFGYFGLNGRSRLDEYVGNINLMLKPTPHLSIVPSVRVQQEDTDAFMHGMQTLGANEPVPFDASSERGVLDVRERLDITYNGFTNWVLYARGELTEGDGNLDEAGGLVPINGIGIPPILRQTDDERFFQKYSAGVRWYPLNALTLDAGGYYKFNHYEYDNEVDSTPNDATSANRYPAYLVLQDFETWDGNIRLTLRPLRNLSLVSRYEYQYSTIQTQPDPISGLSKVESSKMPSHIFAQDVNWSPWSRLYLQAGFNYVVSETETPASDYTQAILNAQNNYWTLNFSSGLVLDDKTDLKVGYFYYQSDNFEDNSLSGLPLGMSAQQHGVTATLTRRITKNLRLKLRYGFFHYDDITFGGNRDYDAHMVYSSLQYRF